MSNVFISYRRKDSGSAAGRLYDDLCAHFDDAQVFMDLEIDKGEDFERRLGQQIGQCTVLLAIIGPDWLTMTNDQGSRRLDDPDDYVRLEIATALRLDVCVIPVLVDGASMPGGEDLPPALKKLRLRNAMELSHTRWSFDVGVLMTAIEKVGPRPAAQALDPVHLCGFFEKEMLVHRKHVRATTMTLGVVVILAILIPLGIRLFADVEGWPLLIGPTLIGLGIAGGLFPLLYDGRGRLSECTAVASLIDCRGALPPEHRALLLQENQPLIKQRVEKYILGTRTA